MVISPVRWSRPIVRGRRLPPGGGGGGRSAPTPPPVTSTAERNRIFDDFRAGRISRGDAIGKISGAGAKASFQQRVTQETQRIEQMRRAGEAKIKADTLRTKLLNQQAKIEMNRIANLRSQMIRNRARLHEQTSRDVKTGNTLNITTWTQNSNKVRRVFDTVTGEVKYTTFGVPRGGGSIQETGGVILAKAPKPQTEQIDLDNLSPSQAIALVNAGFSRKDVENWGERLTGIERLHAGTKGITEKLIRKLERGEKLGSKDRLLLLTLQFGIPAQQLIIGLKQLPDFTRSIKDDPKLLLAVPGQLWDGLKQTGAEIIALGKVSPDLAIARIGGELFLMKGLGAGFKVNKA